MDDYSYTFDAISDCLGMVQLVDQHAGGDLTFQAALNDQRLSYWPSTEVRPQMADLADLALAVHIADRFSGHVPGRSARIQITLPVREPALFNDPATLQALCDVLYWYTEDSWSFSFTQRTKARRATERQSSFDTALMATPRTEVALWSGGLDSFAGLWQRQIQHPETHYVLFGTGANLAILHRQQELLRLFRDVSSTQPSLVQVPLRLRTPRGTSRNRYQRTRGFVFLLLGSVCAQLEGLSVLHLYENGVGALNLPFRAAEVGTDHSRSVHPLSLLRMGNLVSCLLGASFTFVNPFLFSTKTEMCASLRGTAAEGLIAHTTSCDSRLRHPDQPTECGRCSSCLLRRQAIAASGLTDQTAYATQTFADSDDRFVLDLMLGQRNTFHTMFEAASPWDALRRRYPILQTTATRMAQASDLPHEQLAAQILSLYTRYAEEWDQVQHLLDPTCSHGPLWGSGAA